MADSGRRLVDLPSTPIRPEVLSEWQGGAAPESRVADQCVAVLVGHPLSVDFLSGISMGRIRDRPLPQSPGRILLWVSLSMTWLGRQPLSVRTARTCFFWSASDSLPFAVDGAH